MNIYTDGSILSNVNSTQGGIYGGAGVYIEFATGKSPVCIQDKIKNATNNIAELTAIKLALDYLQKTNDFIDVKVCIYSDSMYCLNSITKWYKKWKLNDWKTSKGEDVKNKELIVDITNSIDEVQKKYSLPLEFAHVKGHAGNFGNEKADQLAKAACHFL